jgi:hypothetical protein
MRFFAAMEIRLEAAPVSGAAFSACAGFVSNGVTGPAVLSCSKRATPNLTLAPV